MSSDSRDTVVWFFAGVAIGAVIALLYAPKSGKQTRKAIADAGKDLVDRGQEIYERGRKMADEAADLIERGTKFVRG